MIIFIVIKRRYNNTMHLTRRGGLLFQYRISVLTCQRPSKRYRPDFGRKESGNPNLQNGISSYIILIIYLKVQGQRLKIVDNAFPRRVNMKNNQTLWVLGHKVTYVETIGDYALLEVSATSNVPGPPPHYHEDTPELFHIISGKLDVLHDGHWRTLEKGQSLIIPKKERHTFINNTPNEARFITTFSPKGFEGFFLEYGIPVETKDAFRKSIADDLIQRVVQGCKKYGMIVVDGE